MEKIVFVAHQYHRKTRSYEFLVGYLREFFEVDLVFDDEYNTGEKLDWSVFGPEYKAVLIFQVFPEAEDFYKIQNNNIIYIPMYDHVVRWPFSRWKTCKNVKFLNFSKTLHDKLTKWGFKSLYLQFFIEPKEFSPGIVDEVFFWQRVSWINISTVRKIFKNSIVKLHIHKVVDPGHEFVQPSSKDDERFKITYSNWFDTKEEMQEFIKTKGIYVAPRFLEGIGMSFLEALSQGKVVIANNQPTMNEYIEHGKNGFLCNYKFPRPIRLNDVEKIQKAAYDSACKGYQKWIEDRIKIVDLINEEVSENEFSLMTKILMPFLLIDRKRIFRMKTGKNASLELFGKKIY